MLILWESTTSDMPTGTSKVAMEELESMELSSFEAREFNVIVETWEIDPKNTKKFIKTLVYK